MTFQEIYLSYGKMVFNLALQYVQHIEDAEEITQDVFVAVHESLDKFQSNSSEKTWVYRITIRKSLDFLKAKQTQKRGAVFTNLFFEDSNKARYEGKEFNHPGVLLEQKEATQKIFDAINQLNDSQKTVLILCKIEQKSQVEVAEIMQLSASAVESLLGRAKAKLAEKLNNKGSVQNK